LTRIQNTLNGNTSIIFFGIIAFLFLTFTTNTSNAQRPLEDSSSNVLIFKQMSNSYSIDNGTAFIKPFFDTTYVISGSSSSLNNSQYLINSTIINDFISSPTIGYIMQINNDTNLTSNKTVTLPSVPNPFVDIADVTKSVSNNLANALNSAIKSNISEIDVRCHFGNNIQQWTCEVFSLPT
jgi:hypothetical protein